MRTVQLFLLLLVLRSVCAAVLGVDLGANSYKAAVIRGGGIDILLNDLSKRKTPTIVAFHPEEGVVYGDAALTYALRAPDRAVSALALHLGRGGPHAAPLQESERGAAEFRLAEGQNIAIEAIVSLLLSKVRAAGGNVRDVALSVPAWFAPSQRRALLDAAELAGMSVLSLINDGTALAVAYATLREPKSTAEGDAEAEHVVMLDIGAWGSRATLLSLRMTTVEGKGKTKNRVVPFVSVLQHAWEENAAGDAIDALLAAHLQKHVPHALTRRAQEKLLREAKRVKEVLSANTQTIAQIEGLVDDYNLRAMVTRKELELLIEPLLPRLVAPLERVLSAANLSASALSAVELVGGGGRVPAVQAALSAVLGGRALDKHLNGDEALVEGAALYAASLSSGLRVREVRLRDGSPLPFNAHLPLLPEADGDVHALADGSYSVALFKRGSKVGGRRTLKVHASAPFSVRIECAAPELLSHGAAPDVAEFSVHGFDALPSSAEPPRVVMQFRLSSSGIVELERVHAEIVETVQDEQQPQQPQQPVAEATENAEKKDESNNKAAEQQAEEEAKADVHEDATGSNKAAEQEQAAAEQPQEEKTAGDEKQKKKRVRHLALQSTTRSPRVQMSSTDRRAAEEVLSNLRKADEERRERDAAKNALEAELYAIRERLDDDAVQGCSTAEEREQLTTLMSEHSAWLDDTTSTTPKRDYVARRARLKELFDPIMKRVHEEELRPRAVQAARTVLAALPSLLANASAALDVAESEVQESLTDVQEALKWLDDVTAQQAQRARHETAAFTSEEVAERSRRLEKRVRKILSRPPRPPPTPPAPPKTDESNNDAPKEPAAPSTDRQQEALHEEKERVPEN